MELLGSEQLGQCPSPGQDVAVNGEHLDRDLVRAGDQVGAQPVGDRLGSTVDGQHVDEPGAAGKGDVVVPFAIAGRPGRPCG
jgi:hypothetical protein